MTSAPIENELGMRLVPVESGTFTMGAGDDVADPAYDERPRHAVTIREPLYVADSPVTNAQYERFDETHAARRGMRGFSTADDEAAIGVSWHDAVAFCAWLRERTGDPYRLPTEAEWEYTCRAGTDTPYHTGDRVPAAYRRHQTDDWHPTPVDLTVGQTPANAWGLTDCHGLVEEWCLDWHALYPNEPRTDPVGPASGVARVTRGGSHNTDVRHLRSASRSGALPATRSWLIGFRPVISTHDPTPAATAEDPTNDRRPHSWRPPTPAGEPFFDGPIRFVRPTDRGTVVRTHNHCPAVTWCRDGSLLAIWFSTEDETDREMVILGSRLAPGATAWTPASRFFDVPDRNLTGSALLHDDGTVYHFNGVGAASHWANLAPIVRTSTDHGHTWSQPRLIDATFTYRHQVIAGAFRTRDGALVLPCDAVSSGHGGTAIHISPDGGHTWRDPGASSPPPRFDAAEPGGWIAGIHAGITELEDGRLLAFGRGDTIDGCMPQSVSSDGGRTWRYEPSPFPPISGGQRLVLRRLREGPLLFASFTDPSDRDDPAGMRLRTPSGALAQATGLFVAVSVDDGDSWPIRRLIAPDEPSRTYDGGGWTGDFTTSDTTAEPMGYLAATQTPDGVIHLLSSALHYRFNLDWLMAGENVDWA